MERKDFLLLAMIITMLGGALFARESTHEATIGELLKQNMALRRSKAAALQGGDDSTPTQPVAGAQTPPQPNPPPPNAPPRVYPTFFQETLDRELGPFLASALYDPDVLVQYIKMPGYMVRVDPNKHVDVTRRGFPPGLNTPEAQLVYLKRSISLALGRMHRDVSMAQQFAATAEEDLPMFERAVRHFIHGQVRNTAMIAQVVIDFNAAKAHLNPLFQRRNELFEGHDPLWAFLAQVSSTATPEQITEIWNNLGKTPKASQSNPAVLHPAEQLYHLEYHRAHFDHQQPRNQKYMSILRPSASCFHVHRECEEPDGCRFYCNFPYLQSARDPAVGGKPFHHRLLGFGSNNQYDYELMMWKYFGYGTFAAHNKVYSMTSFDCTLKKWLPPQELISSPIGWGGASFCVGDQTGTFNNASFVAFQEMKQRILESEKPGEHPTVLRNKMAENVAAPVNTDYFDEVSILKIDVEGSEFKVFDAWAQGEIASFNRNTELHATLDAKAAGNSFPMIDFRKVISEFFTVSMVLVEVHSWGGQFHGYDHIGAFHMLHMMQQLNQMGFVMVAFEKNFFGDCCFELVYVHYRFFTRSEVWLGKSAELQKIKELQGVTKQ